MDETADGLHEEARDDVAGHGRERLDPKKKTSTGIIGAPPPIPVMPKTPTTSPATAIAGSRHPMSYTWLGGGAPG
jgi:hypothetical protein